MQIGMWQGLNHQLNKMPIYLYKCPACSIQFTTKHGMSETCEECPTCSSTNVSRVPTTFTTPSVSIERTKKTGEITKEFIENAREDLNTQKEELDRKR